MNDTVITEKERIAILKIFEWKKYKGELADSEIPLYIKLGGKLES